MGTMIYTVDVVMKDINIKEDELREFIEKKLNNIEIENIVMNKATLIWPIDLEEGGPHEIEEAMYYVLGDDKLGVYDYERLK